MKWISFQEQLPPSQTYILLTDGHKVMPYFTYDLGHFIPEHKLYNAPITFKDATILHTQAISYWSHMPQAPEHAHKCIECNQTFS